MKIRVSKCLWILLVLVLTGCRDEMDKYYERPDWLRGSAYEVLQKQGNYSLFLKAVDRAGFSVIVNGQGLCSVFAPDDDLFAAYLASKGWNSVEEVPVKELELLVGFHIVQFAYKPSDLMNFQPGGVLNPPTKPGIYYKHKTFGKAPAYQTTDPLSGKEYTIYKREKYLPVLSTDLFKSKELQNPEYNYKYFYPQGTWQGDGHFYVANASVKENGNGLIADNGYVYLIDKILEPVRNIYDILEEKQDRYSTFKSLYDRFANIAFDQNLTTQYSTSSTDSIFVYNHRTLPAIASEWTFNFQGGFTENVQMASGTSFNACVPDNVVLNQFLSGFFPDYETAGDIPLLPVAYLLLNHVNQAELLLPEEIGDGRAFTVLGDPIDFDPDQAVVKELCTNGVFYGMDRVLVPAPFKTVTKPVFQNPDYSVFMHLLQLTGEIIQLTNPDIEFTLLIPNDDAFSAQGIQLNAGDPLIYGDEKLEKLNIETALYDAMTSLELTQLVSLHIVPRKITDFSKQSIYPVKQNLSYLRVFDGGVAGEGFGSSSIPVTALGEFSNGVSYEVGDVITKSSESLVNLLNGGDYEEFWKLLDKAGYIQDINGMTITLISGEIAMVFAPTNEAILQAVGDGIIPEDPAALREYLQYFFVSMDRNKLSSYVLPGLTEEAGEYQTMFADPIKSNMYETVYYPIQLVPDPDNFRLKLVNNTGMAVAYTLSGIYPRFASDGLVYQIESAAIQPE